MSAFLLWVRWVDSTVPGFKSCIWRQTVNSRLEAETIIGDLLDLWPGGHGGIIELYGAR